MKVAVWADSGIGGTEKAASIFAVELARRGYEVDYLTPRRGVRTEHLLGGGVRVCEGQHDCSALQNYLRKAKPDVIHQHVPGYPIPNPIYPALDRLSGHRPALIETNIFGRFEDRQSEGVVRYRMFVSCTSAVQAFLRAKRPIEESSLVNCTVLTNPLLPVTPSSAADRNGLRAELGIREREVLAIRVGQPGRGKWTDWEAKALLQAREELPNLHLLLMEPPPELGAKLTRLSPGGGIIVLPATADFARLNALYHAADLMVHATYFGESFGYTIAEGMQSGLPVITRSTPWGDNAQVELVENGISGFVCATVAEMARRFVELGRDEALRRRMGDAARSQIAALADAAAATDVLEAVIHRVTSGEDRPLLEERRRRLLEFAADFPARQHRFSEPLSPRPLEGLSWLAYRGYRSLRTALRRVIRKAGGNWVRSQGQIASKIAGG